MASNEHHFSDTIKYTSCAGPCTGSCILKVRIRNGVIVSCEPYDIINPGIAREDEDLLEGTIGQGMINTRPCAKGYAMARMIYDPNRVVYPMKRVGQRGEGKFKRITWDEALGTIAQKLVEVKKNTGPTP